MLSSPTTWLEAAALVRAEHLGGETEGMSMQMEGVSLRKGHLPASSVHDLSPESQVPVCDLKPGDQKVTLKNQVGAFGGLPCRIC